MNVLFRLLLNIRFHAEVSPQKIILSLMRLCTNVVNLRFMLILVIYFFCLTLNP